ncbi:MAG: thioredoxin family protein [Candidatus Puniceispirillales bacterium]
MKAMKTLMTGLMLLMLAGVARAGDLTPTMGEDGIYHYDWYHQSFLEMEDDIIEALDEGKILMVKYDQKGCIYCEKIALEILSEPAINAFVREHFVVVQLDLYGNRDVTDLDGETMPENEMARKWGVVFTPTIYFVGTPSDAPTLPEASDAIMPGAFGKLTFLGFLQWIKEGGYDGDEPFQKYFGRRMNEIRSEIDAARAASS